MGGGIIDVAYLRQHLSHLLHSTVTNGLHHLLMLVTLQHTQHSTAQHSTAQHSTAQHSTAQHSTAQHSTAQLSTAQHSTAQHSTAQHSTAQHSTAQHSTAQHSTSRVASYITIAADDIKTACIICSCL
jgi:hypothetical protein